MFKIINKDQSTIARIGVLETRSGKIETPFFMPVATKATAKYLSSNDLQETGAKAIICNSFILSLRPGIEVVKKFTRLADFMSFPGIVFTDSGGFQMYAESLYINSTIKGISFRNPFSGEKIFISPEDSMKIQCSLGADVAMCLDSMPLISASFSEVEKAVSTTTQWAKRCKSAHDKIQKNIKKERKQLLFGICQGGVHKALRERSTKDISKIDFDGYAIGGLALGEPREEMYRMIAESKKLLPENKPVYVMGVGHPVDVLTAISLGADIFDSRFPTKTARHGGLLTWNGKLNILNAKYKVDSNPIDKNCGCFVCKNYSISYIRHLLLQEEGNGYRLASFHNLHFMQSLIKKAKERIMLGDFQNFKKSLEKKYIKGR